jgi:3-oxoacyl-[acyl-carrier protein] reductase
MRILITGGASGLGKSITSTLAKNNSVELFITFSNSQKEALTLERLYKNIKAIKCDFKNHNDIGHLIKVIGEADFDVLVNNALTGMLNQHAHKIEILDYLDSFTNNVLPVVEITNAVIRQFRKKKSGKIITILTSELINKPSVGWAEYTANKAYLHSMCKSWAVENAGFNITSNCVSPSMMQTQLTTNIDARLVENSIEKTPLKKLLTTEETARTVEFLVNASPQINGINLIINQAEDVI